MGPEINFHSLQRLFYFGGEGMGGLGVGGGWLVGWGIYLFCFVLSCYLRVVVVIIALFLFSFCLVLIYLKFDHG